MTTKPWYLSRTILGSLLSSVSAFLAIFGVQISPELQGQVVELVLAISTAGGLLLTIIGRIKARSGINFGRSSGTGSGTALALLLATPLALTLLLGACATPAAQSPAQRVYALQADYTAAQAMAVGYVESSAAKPAVVAVIQEADAAAYVALGRAQSAVRAGDDPLIPSLIATAEHAVKRLVALVTQLE
ncbi:hypothetical protein [Telmatospirillum sp. J64-1]|uniref:hypothetical protein n=1 Tax=Telmatospirillum sp. J64-1 TaxID=2502183 RepID=UPI00115DD6D3|nr:hypothetical protein [Telmatospirillum sp. J64-1]